MNNPFSQRISDVIQFGKEEANRLRNNYIGPEHLLLGILRDGSGKAVEALFVKAKVKLSRFWKACMWI